MVLVPQDEVCHFRDRASLIKHTVHIVDQDWSGQGFSGHPIRLDILSINELPGGSSVNEGI